MDMIESGEELNDDPVEYEVICLEEWTQKKQASTRPDLVGVHVGVVETKPTGHAARLGHLKREIAAGRYKIDHLKLAEAIIDRVFREYDRPSIEPPHPLR